MDTAHSISHVVFAQRTEDSAQVLWTEVSRFSEPLHVLLSKIPARVVLIVRATAESNAFDGMRLRSSPRGNVMKLEKVS